MTEQFHRAESPSRHGITIPDVPDTPPFQKEMQAGMDWLMKQVDKNPEAKKIHHAAELGKPAADELNKTTAEWKKSQNSDRHQQRSLDLAMTNDIYHKH